MEAEAASEAEAEDGVSEADAFKWSACNGLHCLLWHFDLARRWGSGIKGRSVSTSTFRYTTSPTRMQRDSNYSSVHLNRHLASR
jgi:hypothetical protein